MDREDELNEMEKWLSEQEKAESENVRVESSSDFDRFLEERAAAAEALPPAVDRNPNSRQHHAANSHPKPDPFGL